MKKFFIVVAGIGLLASGAVSAVPAVAGPGSLSGPYISVSWDDTNWYRPTGCSQLSFQYVTGRANFVSEVTLLNQFGDDIGSKYVMAKNTGGSDTIQVCSFNFPKDDGTDYPLTLQLKASQDFTNGDGSTLLLQAPIVLHTRIAPAATVAAPQVAAPSPTETPQTKPKTIKCISKKTFKKKTFKGKNKCPSGWVKI